MRRTLRCIPTGLILTDYIFYSDKSDRIKTMMSFFIFGRSLQCQSIVPIKRMSTYSRSRKTKRRDAPTSKLRSEKNKLACYQFIHSFKVRKFCFACCSCCGQPCRSDSTQKFPPGNLFPPLFLFGNYELQKYSSIRFSLNTLEFF